MRRDWSCRGCESLNSARPLTTQNRQNDLVIGFTSLKMDNLDTNQRLVNKETTMFLISKTAHEENINTI